MVQGTTRHVFAGRRVEIPAHCDLWMRGARFGTVERVKEGKVNFLQAGDPRGSTLIAVRMDYPKMERLAWFIADDCSFIGWESA